LSSFNTSTAIKLKFWRPPDGFAMPACTAPHNRSAVQSGALAAAQTRRAADVKNPLSATESRLDPNYDCLVNRLQAEDKNERDLRRIGTALRLSWQGLKTTKRAVELRLRQLHFAAYDDFIPTSAHMKLSEAARKKMMFTSQQVPGTDWFVTLQYSVSQLCVELKKLESWASSSKDN
jgi:hypothetical protein